MKVFDLHCDTLSELRRAEMRGDGQTFAHNNGHIDLEKLEKGDYMLQCFAAFVNLADPTPGADPLVTALEEIDVFKRMMEQYSDRIAPVYRPEDIRKNAEAGKISGMLTIEEAWLLQGQRGGAAPDVRAGRADDDPDLEPRKRAGQPQRGARQRPHLALYAQHRDRPEGEGLRVSGRDGASAHHRRCEPPFGQGLLDIVEHATRPFAASHSNCRALAPHTRNLTDEMIRVMAEKGGLVGLNYCAGFLDDQPSPDLCRSTTALMAKHAAHFKQVGGIEIIGLGSDFDGIGGKLELSDCSKMPLLADALRKEGFTEDEVEAIFFRNAQRFFENNL